MSTVIRILQHEPNEKRFAAGETIIEVGQAGEYMYGIKEGEVDVVYNGKVLYSVGPGGLVGELALIDEGPRSASIVAKTDCVLAAIDQKRFLVLVQNTPYFAIDVMKIMAERLRMTTALL